MAYAGAYSEPIEHVHSAEELPRRLSGSRLDLAEDVRGSWSVVLACLLFCYLEKIEQS